MMITTRFEPSDRLLIVVERANKLPASDMNGLSDPYVIVKLNDSFEKKTKIIKKNLNPVWNEEFLFFSLGGRDPLELSLEVFDWDRFTKDDFLGSATLSISSENIDFNKLNSETLNLNSSGSVTIQYKVIRTEQRESGMFPSIIQTDISQSESNHDFNQPKTLSNLNESSPFFDYEFSPMFCPSLPTNFKLLSVKKERKVICQCDFQGPFEKPKNNLIKEPGMLQICYFKITKDKFSRINSEYLSSYFDRLKQSIEIMNEQIIEEVKDRDITSMFKSGKYMKVLENTSKANTTDGLLTIINISCLVGDSMMVVFRYVSYTYEQRFKSTILEIVKQSKIVDLITTSPSADIVDEGGSLYSSMMMDEDYSKLCSPSRLLSNPTSPTTKKHNHQ